MNDEVAIEFKKVSIESLHLDPDNARKHNERNRKAVAKSLAAYGQVEALVVEKGTGKVIGGNCRLEELKSLGKTEVWVAEVDVHEEEATRLGLALNRTAELAEWEPEMLAGLLEDLVIDETLWNDAEIQALMKQADDAPLLDSENEDDVEGLGDGEPDSREGEIYELGEHLLLCGDATHSHEVGRLMAGAYADMVFTDPPYNVDYNPDTRPIGGRSRSKQKLGNIKNDKMDEDKFLEFLVAVNRSIDSCLKPGGAIYQCSPTGDQVLWFLMAFREVGWKYSDGLVWLKNNHSISRKDYHPKHEIIHYGWKEGEAHRWYGERDKFSVFECSREPVTQYVHPTQKPVTLVEHYLQNSSRPGDIILDMFGGSGTTLIAAAKTKRIARLVELDPKYCDVIRKRWGKYAAEQGLEAGRGAL